MADCAYCPDVVGRTQDELKPRSIARRGGVPGVVLAVLLAIAIGVGLLIVLTLRRGGDVDDWVIRQVTRITNAYLIPEIQFTRSAFELPYTLRLDGAALVAPTGERVLEAAELVVTLAERPRWGEPIVIQDIEIRNGALRLLRDPETGGYRGLAPFVRTQSVRSPETVPDDVRLSNVLRIRRIALRNAAIEYDDGSGAPAMRLDGIELAMHVASSGTEDSASPVNHQLDFLLDRAPIFSLDVLGMVSLDTFEAVVDRLDLRMEVGESSYSALPPQIQAMLREYEAQGALRVLLSGSGGIRNPETMSLDGTVSLDDFRVAVGAYQIPIDQATLELAVQDGVARVAPARFDMLGGTIRVTAESAIAQEKMPTTASWEVERLQLADLLRAQLPQGREPELAGVVASSGAIQVNLSNAPASASGSGVLTITEARLLSLPVITRLVQVMENFTSAFGAQGRQARVESAFTITGEGLEFEKLMFTNPISAVSATGTVGYDGKLNLTATAGPVQRIQGMLGDVGKIIGSVTGRLIQYRIRGDVGSPSISVHPLGLGS